jgi:hypothetical protein
MIVGRVERSGIDPRSGAAGAGATLPVPGDPITIRNSAGAAVATAVSDRDGLFQVTLPAAQYTVTEDILGMSQTCDVRNQTVSTVTFVLSTAS